MSISELMRAMSEAGAPLEAIILAVEAIEGRDARLAEKRAIERDRKRRQRSNQSDADGTVTGQSRDSHGDNESTPSPLCPPFDKETPPTPPKEIKSPPISPQPTENSARGSRLSENWVPGELSSDVARIVSGWPKAEIAKELAKFRDYWISQPGAKGRKTNWQATWQNWLRKADEALPRGQPRRAVHEVGYSPC